MKVVTGQVMQSMDQRAIVEFGVPGLALMERAGTACADAISARFGDGVGKKAVIVAGKGNNGGDGFVISRVLSQRGWEAPVLLLAAPEAVTGDAAANLERLDPGVVTALPQGFSGQEHLLESATVVVDALLGTGINSEVGGGYGEAIDIVNACGVPVVAVDIPSGIDAGSGRVLGRAVRAELTVSFALAKLGNVLHPGAELGGRLAVADIGMPQVVIDEAPGYEYVNDESARGMIRKRSVLAHKGSNGHCLIIAGSAGKTGAAAMAAQSALRSAAGLVSLAIPAALNPVLESKTTEAMTIPIGREDKEYFLAGALDELLSVAKGKDAVALGPGLGTAPSTVYLVHSLLALLEAPLVIDADGLNAVAAAPELLLKRRGRVTLLTPHPGEMARLTGLSIPQVEADRIGCARDFAARFQVYLVLKGARSIVAAPDGGVSINGSGNPGMATGGMGDVLTGVIAALLGQGYHPFAAARLGTFLHGYAADLLVEEMGTRGMVATDVQEALPRAQQRLMAANGGAAATLIH